MREASERRFPLDPLKVAPGFTHGFLHDKTHSGLGFRRSPRRQAVPERSSQREYPAASAGNAASVVGAACSLARNK